MARQKLFVNGVEIQIGMHPFKKFLMWSGIVSWVVFCIFAYVQLKGEVRHNSNTLSGMLIADNSVYLKILSQRESGGNFSIIGGSGNHYLGGFQFGRVAMEDIGLIENRREYREFRENFERDGVEFWSQEDQETACIQLMRKNKRYLRDYYSYIGETINGVEITEAGMLAGAHLVGHRGVKRFLETNGRRVERDGNGTPITEYFKLMEGVLVEI